MAEQPVRVEVWSDYVCPFCYLEEPVLERLQATYGAAVQVHWRAFELRPEPVPTLDPKGEYLRSTWQRAVYPMAEQRGMTLRLPPVQPRSRKALEAAEFAREAGHFASFHHALFRAFFEEGLDIGDLEVLRQVATSVGLEGEELVRALAEGRYTQRVLRDQERAQALGITGVPAMVVLTPDGNQGVLVSGAQPYEAVAQAVEHVRNGAPRPEPRS